MRKTFFRLSFLLSVSVAIPAFCRAQPPAPTAAPSFAGVTIEAEDFQPDATAGWKPVKNGEGNYMVDIGGFSHISGERMLQANANIKDAQAKATATLPLGGKWRVWSRFEQPTNFENRFRVEIRQNGKTVGAATMGEKDAPKVFFNRLPAKSQNDVSWGGEGLAEQSFDVEGLEARPIEVVITALDQPAPKANRNVDFIFLTQDLNDTWRANARNNYYPILDAVLNGLAPRYYLRLTAPQAQTVLVSYAMNRVPWSETEANIKLLQGEPSEWIPLSKQDVAHFTTLVLKSSFPAISLRAEIASGPDENSILRAFDWQDAGSNSLLLSLPPYPNKYADEKVMTVEEQYQSIAQYLEANPSRIGREPKVPLAWGSAIPVWKKGRVGDASAALYNAVGLRVFGTFPLSAPIIKSDMDVARERMAAWKIEPSPTVSIGAHRLPPTTENIAKVKTAAEASGVLPLLKRYDYGDLISTGEWIRALKPEELSARWVEWQQKHKGKADYPAPDSNAKTAETDPVLYVDSLKFYGEVARDATAEQAREIPKALGSEMLYGGNFGSHPFYYPRISEYITWFRPSPSGDYASNFGRHLEREWQIGQPGPLVNGFIDEHFRAGMRANPQAVHLQYAMPHAPGNTDASFLRSAFTHLAHGARGLDYFGVGINSAWTENYIDFRFPSRYAAMRDVNRAMATVEDILPTSRPAPSKVALILSDSTERWDVSGVSYNFAGEGVWGGDYKKMRLAYHHERVGIYYALVHNSRPPDLLIEEDVRAGVLRDYDVAYWVGDCIEPNTLKALETWVENGGHLVATAGAMRFDEYHRALPDGAKLLGLESATLTEVDRFFRVQSELPALKPLDWIGQMPALAMSDEIAPTAGSKVSASFKSGKPAVIESTPGKGKVTFIAALPGVAYLWSAYQPKPGENLLVPSRGPSSHIELENFNAEAGALITRAARSTLPDVDANGARIDARLLKSVNGNAIALANYSSDIQKPITLTIRGVPNIVGVSSAVAGKLKFEAAPNGAVTVRYAPGYGDILRIESR